MQSVSAGISAQGAPVALSANRYGRVGSIDIVRGLAMVFMALDHTRDYITNYPFSATDVDHTFLFLFLVRWVTHFCAPAFFLLTGVGAYLYGRKRTLGELRRFLVTRGAWLVLLEFTVIGFGWTFHPGYAMFGVICCLGLSMIFLAAFVGLPRYLLMATALLVIATHDLFDRLQPDSFHAHQWLLFLLHHGGMAPIGGSGLLVLFPLIPWAAVTLLGFSIGPLFTASAPSGRRTLSIAGLAALALFAVLRLTNVYGNPAAQFAFSSPGDWHLEPTLAKTVILFLDVEKYPPSLEYLLMTLGTILVLLAVAQPKSLGVAGRVLETFGRVPLFYYLLHIYLIHWMAIGVAYFSHQPVAWLFHGAFLMNETPDAYGHSVGIACLVWAAVVSVLYWPCVWFARVKSERPRSLLRFL